MYAEFSLLPFRAGAVVWRRMVSPLPVQTRARIRALQALIVEVAAAAGASASAQLDNSSEQPPADAIMRVSLSLHLIIVLY
jgi:hypothetical protein